MRTALGMGLLGLVAAAAVCAWSLMHPETPAPPSVEGRGPDLTPQTRPETPPALPASAGSQQPSLRGLILRAGQAAAGAEVLVYLGQESPGPTVSCGTGEREVHLKDLNFASLCPRAADQVFALAKANQLEDQPIASTRADDAGRFELPVPSGELVVLARASDGAVGMIRKATAGEAVELALTERPIGGSIVDGSPGPGIPVQGAEVLVGMGSPRLAYSRVAAAADGTFEVRVPDGERLWMLVRAPGFGTMAGGWSPDSDTPGPFMLVRERRIAGLVLDGEPVAGAEITFRDALTSRVVSDRLGRFSSDEVGLYLVQVEARASGRIASKRLHWREEQEKLVLELGPSGGLRVRVVDAETGALVGASTAEVIDYLRDSPTSLPSASPGLFVARSLEVGDYRVRADAPGYAPAQIPARVHRDQVEETEVKLWRGHELRGRVTGSDGKPAPHRAVEACRRMPAELNGGPDSSRCAAATTLADGSFAMNQLRAGTYLVAVLDCPEGSTEPYRVLSDHAYAGCPGRFRTAVQVPQAQAVTVSLARGPMASIEIEVEEDRQFAAGCLAALECGQDDDQDAAQRHHLELRAESVPARFEIEPGVCVASVDCGLAHDGLGGVTGERNASRVVEAPPGRTTVVRFSLDPPDQDPASGEAK